MTINLDESITDARQPDTARLLESIQGNVLKGHGRRHAVNIFVRFKTDPKTVREALLPLLKRVVTSAAGQAEQTENWLLKKVPSTFGGFFLTETGYRGLGFSPEQIAELFVEAEEPIFNTRATFKDGMKASRQSLGDPDPSTWDTTFRGQIDALLLLARDDPGILKNEAQEAVAELQKIAEVSTEWGKALGPNGVGFEHFGYADGRSQPVFFKDDLKGEGDMDRWNPEAPLGLVLTRDRTVKDEFAFGSYYVFRKLEQNVRDFQSAVAELAKALGAPDDIARAGAMVVGRFPDGTPLLRSKVPDAAKEPENNFRFAREAPERCPFHAHIRKANPRGDAPAGHNEAGRRIARRGIPYGEPCPASPPSKDVGLLFACYQASIANQFAFIQRAWLNNALFPSPVTGPDPIAGRKIPSVKAKWPVTWGDPATNVVAFDFNGFVTLKGGEYFFAPSMVFLRELAPQ